MKRFWYEASRSELIARVFALESELAVAAVLLENREVAAEHRSPVLTELQRKWRDLLAEEPAIAEEQAA
jgi:hypothetical protein